MGNSHSKEKQYPKLDERKYSFIERRSTSDKDPAKSSKQYSKLDSNEGTSKSKNKGRYMDPRGRKPGDKDALPWASKFSYGI